MELEQIKILRRNLAESINSAIIEFEKETGTHVDSIDITRRRDFGDTKQGRIVSVDVDVSIK